MSAPTTSTRAPESRRIALALLRYFPHGGLQRIALETAEALASQGHRVTLFVQAWEGPLPSLGPALGPALGSALDTEVGARREPAKVEVLPVRGASNHSRAARFGRALAARLRDDPADVVIGFDRLPGLDLYFCADPCYSARLRRDRGALHRWTSRARTFLRLERAVFAPESKTRILLMNGAEQPIIQGEYATPDARFFVLPPGYSSTRRRDAQSDQLRERTRAELGLGGPDAPALLLLALGSDFQRKGFDRAVRALPTLRTSLPNRRAVLAIAGSEDPARLRRLAKELCVAGDVLLLGPRDDVPALLQAADVLVHPCRAEPAGMVLLEALSAGTPVVTSACAGYGHHVAASGAGVVLDEPFQLADLCRALQKLGSSPLSPLGERALHYMANHDPGAMIRAVTAAVAGTVIDEVDRA